MTAAKPNAKSPLGRGLSALFGDQDNSYGNDLAAAGVFPRELAATGTAAAAPATSTASTKAYLSNEVARQPKLVPIEFLYAGKYQPRHVFDEAELQSLAESIRAKGVLQPLLVRRHPTVADAFEIIAGERRWRAAQLAGLHELPVIVRDLSDVESLEVALIENIQRQDLNPIDEAEGYQRLITEFSHTQEVLAKAVGKSRSHIANMLRLLGLPASVKEQVRQGTLSMGHARALLSVDNPEAAAAEILNKGLNVRAVEDMARQSAKSKAKKPVVDTKDVDTLALEREVSSWLGLTVKISNPQGKVAGSLTISYQNLDQLEDVLKRLSMPSKIVV